MGRVVGHLRAKKCEVIDLTIPGWIATKENIDSLVTRMSELKNLGNFAVIMDLHSNSTFRFSYFDGTQVKEGKKYHFPGEILPVSDDLFKKINDSLKTILLSAQDHIKIIIPPLPRYVFDRCCTNTTHCKNFGTDNYQTKVLDSCTHLRNILKKLLAEMGCANYWVLDGLGAILGVNSGTDRGGNSKIIAELRPYLGSDGDHLNEMGYKNLANVICGTVSSMTLIPLSLVPRCRTSTDAASTLPWLHEAPEAEAQELVRQDEAWLLRPLQELERRQQQLQPILV
jgi:hypothetical protein